MTFSFEIIGGHFFHDSLKILKTGKPIRLPGCMIYFDYFLSNGNITSAYRFPSSR